MAIKAMVELETGRLLEVHDAKDDVPLHTDNDGKAIAEWVELKESQGEGYVWDSGQRTFTPAPPPPPSTKAGLEPAVVGVGSEYDTEANRLALMIAARADEKLLAAQQARVDAALERYSGVLMAYTDAKE